MEFKHFFVLICLVGVSQAQILLRCALNACPVRTRPGQGNGFVTCPNTFILPIDPYVEGSRQFPNTNSGEGANACSDTMRFNEFLSDTFTSTYDITGVCTIYRNSGKARNVIDFSAATYFRPAATSSFYENPNETIFINGVPINLLISFDPDCIGPQQSSSSSFMSSSSSSTFASSSISSSSSSAFVSPSLSSSSLASSSSSSVFVSSSVSSSTLVSSSSSSAFVSPSVSSSSTSISSSISSSTSSVSLSSDIISNVSTSRTIYSTTTVMPMSMVHNSISNTTTQSSTISGNLGRPNDVNGSPSGSPNGIPHGSPNGSPNDGPNGGANGGANGGVGSMSAPTTSSIATGKPNITYSNQSRNTRPLYAFACLVLFNSIMVLIF